MYDGIFFQYFYRERSAGLFFYPRHDEDLFCLWGDAVAMVYALAHQPYDVVATAEHPLIALLNQGELVVCHIVAYQLAPLHAQRDESIARLHRAQAEGLSDLGGIEAGCLLVGGAILTFILYKFSNKKEN